jgi:hypothetical protein
MEHLMDEDLLRDLFSELKQILVSLSLVGYRDFHASEVKDVKRLSNRDSFPIDFQCYWDAGMHYIGFSDAVFLDIESPTIAYKSQNYAGLIDDRHLEPNDPFNFGHFDCQMKDILIAGYTASAWHIFGYDIRKTPYKFIDTLYSEENSELTFLDLLLMLFSDLSSMECDNPIFKDLQDWCTKVSHLLRRCD